MEAMDNVAAKTEDRSTEARGNLSSMLNANTLFGIIISAILGALIFLFTTSVDNNRLMIEELTEIKTSVHVLSADVRENFATIAERHRQEDLRASQ